MKKPVNYSTEQLTTAKREFIHDVEFEVNPDGTFNCICDLADSIGTPPPAPFTETVTYDRTGERLPVLSFLGRQWVLWGRVCSLLGQQRQFLNYRIINNHDQVEILRMDARSASNLSDFVGKAVFSSAKAPRARCKTIFFDFGALTELRRNVASRNKLRAMPKPGASRSKRASDGEMADEDSDAGSAQAEEDEDDAQDRQSHKRVHARARGRAHAESDSNSEAGDDEDDATNSDAFMSDSASSLLSEEQEAATILASPNLTGRRGPTGKSRDLESQYIVSEVYVRTMVRADSRSPTAPASKSTRASPSSVRARSHTPLWISMMEETTVLSHLLPAALGLPALGAVSSSTGTAVMQRIPMAAITAAAAAAGLYRRKPKLVHRAVRREETSDDSLSV